MIAEFSIIPLGKGVSVSGVVAKVVELVEGSGLAYKLNPMGTVVEGGWTEVMSLVERCHNLVMEDAERAVTSIRIDDRKGYKDRITGKVESVEKKLGHAVSR